ncbi:WD40 repeat domain 95 [Podochytrium sp. JEL0797]|nr:WD40 repeat domain 95 [Podochytrium sp. JEL0797]
MLPQIRSDRNQSPQEVSNPLATATVVANPPASTGGTSGGGGGGQAAGNATANQIASSGIHASNRELPQVVADKKKAGGRTANFNSDVQQYMNIQHFEQLMQTFHAHKNEDGSSGFDIDKFREVFGKVLGGNLSYDQMTMLFMKIDANSDGTVDWDEFSTYMMAGSMGETEHLINVIDEKIRKLINGPHKDMIKRIDFVPKERKYVTVRLTTRLDSGKNQTGPYDGSGGRRRFGVAGGYVNVLQITRKFLFDNSSDSDTFEQLTPAKLQKKDSLKKNSLSYYRRKIHNDWVLKVQYYPEMNGFVSCASENTKSLVIGDLERKTVRYIHVPKGIKCFDVCRRPSFLVTGGRDKIIRLWTPYVLSKPAGNLHGHNTSIVNLIVNHEESQLISLSEDKVIKIWNIRNLNCLQTLMDKVPHRPENIISAIFFDNTNRQLLTGSNKLESWPLYKNLRHTIVRSHDAGIVSAMFNENFHQVVSGCQAGTVSIWDLASGDKIFQFHNAHAKLEITAMFFRIPVGMWNFNNGMILRKMIKPNPLEATDVIWVEMGSNHYIIAVGWDRKITIFVDDNDHFEMQPVRILNGAGWGAHKGHEDDISSIAFCPPNLLATSSVDGVIVIWNLESGYIKLTLREPFLDLRSKEEKVVEKILFLQNPERMSSRWHKIPLISCHADGYLRFWDIYEGCMVYEMNCQITEDEGLGTMALNPDSTLLLLGGSRGHIRVFDLSAFLIDSNSSNKKEAKNYESQVVMKTFWRAHVQSISSVNYVNAHDVILTSSKDGTVRVWTSDGTHIGIFGQDVPWVIDDPSTYMPLPVDVKKESAIEKQHNQLITNHRENLKKDVIETWKHGISKELEHELGAPEEKVDLGKKMRDMRLRAIQSNANERKKQKIGQSIQT